MYSDKFVTIQQINSTIISGQFTNDQLDSIVMAVKFARNQLTQQNRGSMVIGTTVKFTGKTGRTTIGNVKKVARKFVTVDCGAGGLWRVPANMLERA